jgi:DNA-binding NarL/FixJ family response regulator
VTVNICCPSCGAELDLWQELTLREIEVLCHIAQGQSNKEIERDLRLAHDTVKNHIAHIMQKLMVPNRTAAVMQGIERGLIHVEVKPMIPAPRVSSPTA